HRQTVWLRHAGPVSQDKHKRAIPRCLKPRLGFIVLLSSPAHKLEAVPTTADEPTRARADKTPNEITFPEHVRSAHCPFGIRNVRWLLRSCQIKDSSQCGSRRAKHELKPR